MAEGRFVYGAALFTPFVCALACSGSSFTSGDSAGGASIGGGGAAGAAGAGQGGGGAAGLGAAGAGQGGSSGAGTAGAAQGGSSVAGAGLGGASTGGHAGTSAGGVTAVGGATSGTLPLPNWLPAISAAYLFEKVPPNIGDEAHGIAALHLADQSTGAIFPVLDTLHKIEGTASASLLGLPADGPGNTESFFASVATTLPAGFATPAGTSITIGGWYRITATSHQQWLMHDEGAGGFGGGFFFLVDQNSGKLSTKTAIVECQVGSESSFFSVVTDNVVGFDPVAGDGWLHLVCRYDASNHQLAVFVGGAKIAQVTDALNGIGSGPGPFTLGCDNGIFCGFVGNMDEVFFTQSALDDAHVNRIHACGIDGSRCRCVAGNPAAYASCGFAGSSCASGAITTCNAAQ